MLNEFGKYEPTEPGKGCLIIIIATFVIWISIFVIVTW